MNKYMVLLVIASVMLLSGCIQIFQPDPPSYREWKKSGVNESETLKAMLECGSSPSFDSQQKRISPNDTALLFLCMKNDGFVFGTDNFDYCARLRDKPPACSYDTPIPLRSAEKRLNSRHCHDYPEGSTCQP